MKHILKNILFMVMVTAGLPSCINQESETDEMLRLLAAFEQQENTVSNPFRPDAALKYYDSVLLKSPDPNQDLSSFFFKATSLLQLGSEQQAINLLEQVISKLGPANSKSVVVMKNLGIAYLRLGERINCQTNHGDQSCIFPLTGNGIHRDKSASLKAIKIYELLLKNNPRDLESRWLLNIAYMTLGQYPAGVQKEYLIPGFEADTSQIVKPFQDVAINLGLNTNNMAGGSIIEDFNNDGHLDLITSSWSLNEGMHYCMNNGNGSFTDVSEVSGLKKFSGGLNIMQTDYNNDGLKDIFVLRGAWLREFGKQPNSLLRNNGDGTFTDVTKETGLLSFHPTQTATWNDFNNDGWLDVFIGNESNDVYDGHRSELYINDKKGHFTNIARISNSDVIAFVKGVTSGDYDNDGWADIFISTMGTQKILLRNEGIKDGVVRFRDVTEQAGLGECHTRTFPTWFWDYDNDGWLDILVCSYEFNTSLAGYAAAEALHLNIGNSGRQFLFRNKHDGSFEDVTNKVGLNKSAFAMGSNFGDINNDGYSDIYLGTGNPQYQSLVPNKMFMNQEGKSFADVTSAARVGNLQKGHGVSFSDLDNDGDEDIYIDMGGAYAGDVYQNSLFLNPGQNANNWINISLEGTNCNKAAIGTKLKVTFTENGVKRSVYRDVNSGGSFGSNPLLQHIGIGTATSIESIEIRWPASKAVQLFKQLEPGITIHVREGDNTYSLKQLKRVAFNRSTSGGIGCSPAVDIQHIK